MLQNNYKVVIDYITYRPKSIHCGVVVIGKAGTVAEVVTRIQEKFAPNPSDNCTIRSIEYLGWETF